MATWKKPFRVLDGSRNKIGSYVQLHSALRNAARIAKARNEYTAIVVSPSGKDLAVCSSGSSAVNRKRTRDSSGRHVKVLESGASRRYIASCRLTPAGRAMIKRSKARR